MVFTLFCGCQKAESVEVDDSNSVDSVLEDDEATDEDVADVEVFSLPTELEEADIYVQKVEGISNDFIKGMDVSSVLSEEASAVKYYDLDGNEDDVFRILAKSGINYVRVRVWNNPYDEDGNGYGGGNCDLNCAKELGLRATKYGMKSCIDFHYSDFWADPSKQMAPKEWEDYTFEDKVTAISKYTEESLNTLLDAGVDIGMVQIGNEINHGLAGVDDFNKELELLVSASNAVRKVSSEKNADIKIVVHFTEIDNPDNILKIAGQLEKAGVDYDVFGVSYYGYWHGTMENMTTLLSNIKNQYGKDTCVMETSYPFSEKDVDGSANSISGEDGLPEYPVSVQGQANYIRDVMAASVAADSLGVFYWEGCWVAASSDYASNKSLYEDNGSGWASSYAKAYDPKDAGKYYGGCSWDNQTLFDEKGKALSSLDVFKYVNYGAVGKELEILSVPELNLEVQKGSDFSMPEEVSAIYNDTSVKTPVKVVWDEKDLESFDVNVSKVYSISGTTDGGFLVKASVKVASLNYIKNPGFEDSDVEMWETKSYTSEDPTDIQNKAADAYDGNMAFHFWSKSEQEFDAYQEVNDVSTGSFRASAFVQGGDVGDDAEIYLFANVMDGDNIVAEYKSEPVGLTGWVNWQNPTIDGIEVKEGNTVQVGMHITCAAGGWGTFDEVELVME